MRAYLHHASDGSSSSLRVLPSGRDGLAAARAWPVFARRRSREDGRADHDKRKQDPHYDLPRPCALIRAHAPSRAFSRTAIAMRAPVKAMTSPTALHRSWHRDRARELFAVVQAAHPKPDELLVRG